MRGWIKKETTSTVTDADVLAEAAQLSSLIAAAPEMLAALEEVVEFWVAMNPGIQGQPLEDARAAIARARGEG